MTQSKSIIFCCISIFGDWRKKNQKKSLNPYHFHHIPIDIYEALLGDSYLSCFCMSRGEALTLFQIISSKYVYSESLGEEKQSIPLSKGQVCLVFDVRDGVSHWGNRPAHLLACMNTQFLFYEATHQMVRCSLNLFMLSCRNWSPRKLTQEK